MKLYQKKLSSLEALKREKIRLRYERRHTNVDDLNPLAEIGGTKFSGKAKEGLFGTVMELFNSKSELQTALALSKPVFKMLRKRRAKKMALRAELGLPKKDSFLKKLAVEIIVGYATGKAVQMTIRGVQLLLKRRKAARLKAGLR